MENFQFRLLTYRLEAQIFSYGGHTKCSYNCALVRQSSKHVCFTHTVPRHTYSTSQKLFLSYP